MRSAPKSTSGGRCRARSSSASYAAPASGGRAAGRAGAGNGTGVGAGGVFGVVDTQPASTIANVTTATARPRITSHDLFVDPGRDDAKDVDGLRDVLERPIAQALQHELPLDALGRGGAHDDLARLRG